MTNLRHILLGFDYIDIGRAWPLKDLQLLRRTVVAEFARAESGVASMKDPPLPFIWPDYSDTGFLIDWLPFGWHTPFHACKILGTVSNFDETSLERIEIDLKASDACRLVIALYPGCKTREKCLNGLLSLQESNPDKFEVRIAFFNRLPLPGTALALYGKSESETCLLVGQVPDLGMTSVEHGHCNMLWSPSAVLLDAFCKWFNDLWKYSAPLRKESTNIPNLVLPQGSQETMNQWSEYVKRCRTLATEEPPPHITTSEQIPMPEPSDTVPTASEEIGIKRLDPLAKDLIDLRQGNVLPKLSYMEIRFTPGEETDWRFQWGQAFTLLESIAQYPRNLLTTSSPMRGLSTRLRDLLNTMNVLDDPFVEAWNHESRSVAYQAENDLRLIADISDSDLTPKEKCKMLIKFVRKSST